MGMELVKTHSEARVAFALASDVLGMDMESLCFDTQEDTLSRTENAQPALFTVSMAAFKVLEAAGILPDAVAGFSLGECTALCASGRISWADGLRMVRSRALAMQRAAETHPGAMLAVLGLPWGKVEELCRECEGCVQPVNDNAPGNCVVAGTPSALDELSRLALVAGALRTVPLAVSAAFHTPDMAEAGAELEDFMRRETACKSSIIPLYTNLTGVSLPEDADLPAHMSSQMQSPVLWRQCVSSMCESGIDTFLEVGEGRVLSGLIRRINRLARCYPAGDPSGIDRILAQGGYASAFTG